jgi:type II secretory pathway component PulK
MNRHGFALVTTLWVVAALGVLVTVGLAAADVDRQASENRMLLRRAEWAGRACLAMVRGRYRPGATRLETEMVDLGRGAWCRAYQLDPTARLNLNLADSVGLARVLGDNTLAAAVLDWRDPDAEERDGGAELEWYRGQGRPTPRNGPFAAVSELLLVRGFEEASQASLETLFTVRGDGRIDPNTAPLPVLRGISPLPEAGVDRLVRLRQGGTHFEDVEEVGVASGTVMGAARFRELSNRLVFSPSEHAVRVIGGASNGGRTIRATLTASVSTAGGRLTVRRLEVGP